MSAKVEKTCGTCGQKFQVWKYALKKGRGKYCSVSCARRSYVGKKNGRWKGGRVKGPGGRILVYAPGHPAATLCGSKYILEYRLIAEKKIGRLLKRNEIVHHKNGNEHDNRPENLEVMTQSEHARHHALNRRKK